jgi:hypothetical protein
LVVGVVLGVLGLLWWGGLVLVVVLGLGLVFSTSDAGAAAATPIADPMARDLRLTQDGAVLGTLPYMSPEQCGMDDVDARSDLWAVGVILYELITGHHPLAPVTVQRVVQSAAGLDEPMPSVGRVVSDLPLALHEAIDRCLRKRKRDRVASARELLGLLEQTTPGHRASPLNEGESPYRGLAPFQEADATRFFGRAREIRRAVARLRERSLIAIAGPSGVGKSSFVRAGVIPALKASGDAWEALCVRPGRDPIGALAATFQSLAPARADAASRPDAHAGLVQRLRTEPGLLGRLLRDRARERRGRIVLFVDQFEELYTLGAADADRRCFADCLTGVADDPISPLRVVLSMRSDFLDRIAEYQPLIDAVASGLLFLAAPDRDGLREVLLSPLDATGYRFESPATVEDMLNALQTTAAALPLLQFAAGHLWDARDRQRRLLPTAAYTAIGGISGALAAHADDVVAGLPATSRRVVRAIFERLVTPERTRAVVDVEDLLALSPDRGEASVVIERLVEARLLTVQTAGETDGATAEIVHESLIAGWPRLRRWLDESNEDMAFRAQLHTAAKQWERFGRSTGMLWRGDAAQEAERWMAREPRVLPEREKHYVDAVLRLATRSARFKRAALAGTLIVLGGLVVTFAAGLLMLRSAEQTSRQNATRFERAAETARREQARAKEAAARAREAAALADAEADRALKAEKESAARLAALEKERARADGEETRRKAEQARAKAADEELRRVDRNKEAKTKRLKKDNRPF